MAAYTERSRRDRTAFGGEHVEEVWRDWTRAGALQEVRADDGRGHHHRERTWERIDVHRAFARCRGRTGKMILRVVSRIACD